MTKTFRIAHISDLHIGKFSWNPAQFFSKRWVGNLNFLFNRSTTFSTDNLLSFIPWLQENNIDQIIITGDLSTTGRKAEFSKARQIVETFTDKGFPVICLPGNHDHYTKKNYRQKTFYQFFENPSPRFFSLKQYGLEAGPLFENFWYVALDTSIATSLFDASGVFSEDLEKRLIELFSLIPEKVQILLLNHFPLYCNDEKKKQLHRSEALLKVLQNTKRVCLYLHGHSHRSCLADLRGSNLPILLDAGSFCYRLRSSFNLITLSENSLEIEILEKKKHLWENVRKETFSFLDKSSTL